MLYFRIQSFGVICYFAYHHQVEVKLLEWSIFKDTVCIVPFRTSILYVTIYTCKFSRDYFTDCGQLNPLKQCLAVSESGKSIELKGGLHLKLYIL